MFSDYKCITGNEFNRQNREIFELEGQYFIHSNTELISANLLWL